MLLMPRIPLRREPPFKTKKAPAQVPYPRGGFNAEQVMMDTLPARPRGIRARQICFGLLFEKTKSVFQMPQLGCNVTFLQVLLSVRKLHGEPVPDRRSAIVGGQPQRSGGSLVGLDHAFNLGFDLGHGGGQGALQRCLGAMETSSGNGSVATGVRLSKPLFMRTTSSIAFQKRRGGLLVRVGGKMFQGGLAVGGQARMIEVIEFWDPTPSSVGRLCGTPRRSWKWRSSWSLPRI